MEKDLISVIVPVYNSLPYIERCVNSLRSQSYENIEILLIDDGSDDGSGNFCDVAASGDGRVKVIHTENQGASAARNIGLSRSKGSYIAFADSDDYVDAQWLSKLYIKGKKSGADITVCGYTLVMGNKCIVPFKQKIYGNVKGESAMLPLLTKSGCGGFLWNKLFKAELFANRRFNESVYYCEDMLIIMSCICDNAAVCFMKDPLYFYRKNPQSVTETFSDKSISVIKAYDEMLLNAKISPRIRNLLKARRVESAVKLMSAAEKSKTEKSFFFRKIIKGGKRDFLKCKDVSLYEKLRFYVRLYAPKLGENLIHMKEKL